MSLQTNHTYGKGERTLAAFLVVRRNITPNPFLAAPILDEDALNYFITSEGVA
ncbi:asr4449 [Nostoc sp. PCC 7120 = FACHB-418]|nr:asr4449 [Nostoc sp. PCC 7120 = FACHB-418]